MIPLRDSIPNVHRPKAVWLFIVLNACVFLYELSLGQHQLLDLFFTWGMVPARHFSPGWTEEAALLSSTAPFLTYMFLHSGWAHFLLNMWVLWIFADNIEDVMGPLRFIVFYLLCGMAALAAHVLFNPQSDIPVVGASGAIAGIMGAYMVLYPHGKVLTFIPIFFIPYFIEIPAVIFLAVWFVIQIVTGLATIAQGQEGGVAWLAHVGGFVAGIVLLPLFRRRDRCYYCYDIKAGRPQH
ncbi:putative membrane protein [Desulfocurvibacter africanus PCS]|uniref:Putative membrane protein n=1 Tax=Desulfocurvibacter africanus PCS TaxID=1262666 RepID=M5Q1L2_DESAF|nr:rhomboid family intramembrane serine protease [Desulfocurvibacter africanus]EMG37671.1 putative membrane protein [Desulfocurvibacter africanus PCS]